MCRMIHDRYGVTLQGQSRTHTVLLCHPGTSEPLGARSSLVAEGMELDLTHPAHRELYRGCWIDLFCLYPEFLFGQSRPVSTWWLSSRTRSQAACCSSYLPVVCRIHSCVCMCMCMCVCMFSCMLVWLWGWNRGLVPARQALSHAPAKSILKGHSFHFIRDSRGGLTSHPLPGSQEGGWVRV